MKELNPSINLIDTISTLDWIVFCTVLILTGASVIWGMSKREKISQTQDESSTYLDLLLMGRQLTLPLFIATLVATWYGGIFGVTEIAFNQGIFNFVTQGAFWYVAYIIFAFFIINKISHMQAVTLPDLIGKMFGPKSAKLSAVFNFFNVLPIAYAISLGIFSQMIFGGELWLNTTIGVFFVLLYSMWGGFRAVVFSDLVQFFVMCLGVFLVLAMSVANFGGLGFLKESLPSSYFSLTGSVGIGTTLVWGFIALSTLVDPNFYQRCFAANSPKTAKKGILISTCIWFCFDICTTFGAMYAKATMPEANSAHAYLLYAAQILPDGLRGFMLAGILATILSTIDSYLFLAGTTLAYDLAPKRLRSKPMMHHLGVLLVGVLAIIMAQVFNGDIKTVWKTLGSLSAACLLFPVLFGYIFPGRISDKQFVTTCLLGVITTSYWRNATHQGFWQNVDELYIGVLTTGSTLVIFYFYPQFKQLASARKG
ncbi:putative sodium:solute symporter [Halobacteriovorax marinus SJ]|uniref:Sodium:solute symporter n=1 Tax=Halobacteriovorax marinus (strain ATCC BAA-682 / DSM 15412 / SJ) TaxID=862908 RepID=E1X4I1_HALMS|nr:sodium:solute symporter family protein [Halobacteriovorax marinus]CBW25411.1 putative sodium:solute symporter [Halobacteriovorax marinus SJ]